MIRTIGIESKSLIIFEGICSLLQRDFICKKVLSFEEIRECHLLIFERKELSNLKKPKIRLLRNDQIPYPITDSIITPDIGREELYRAIAETMEENIYYTEEIRERLEHLQKQEEDYWGLTAREKALLQGILNEHTNYQMARTLYISEKTVKNNLTELYRKMEVKNRREIQKKFKKLLTVK